MIRLIGIKKKRTNILPLNPIKPKLFFLGEEAAAADFSFPRSAVMGYLLYFIAYYLGF
jgi:hypothetical protein